MANERILIVEDDSQIAEVLAAYLQRDGYLTSICRDGGEAMQMFRQWQPDLVLLDYMLPQVSGNEILAAIRRAGDVPVIMGRPSMEKWRSWVRFATVRTTMS
ncbi:DNA-binding response OmpR family regulator [Variovorax sp. 1126]